MSIKPFLEIIVSKTDNAFVAKVNTSGHFVDCPSCREASVVAAIRAITTAIEEAETRSDRDEEDALQPGDLVH